MPFDSSLARGDNWFSILAMERTLIGTHLANIREAHGWSFSQLEEASGVSRSEIHRVETGAQDCRLVTFLRLAWAMGIPWGQLLDELARPSDKLISTSWVKNDPEFARIEITLGFTGWEAVGEVAAQVSELAVFAAVLARSGNASRQARRVLYPDKATKDAFVAYAAKLDAITDCKWRLDHLRKLSEVPATALKEEGILPLAFLSEFVETAARLRKAKAMIKFWQPFDQLPLIPGDPFAEAARKNLTKTATESKSSDVKPKDLWPALKKQLQQATAETAGAKTALAEFLDVELSRVSQWLSDSPKTAREPGAEYALLMQAWLKNPKRQGK